MLNYLIMKREIFYGVMNTRVHEVALRQNQQYTLQVLLPEINVAQRYLFIKGLCLFPMQPQTFGAKECLLHHQDQIVGAALCQGPVLTARNQYLKVYAKEKEVGCWTWIRSGT